MGEKNYLIEGVSCAGKTSVCHELLRRGYHAINGDDELAYWGDPETGEPLDAKAFEHWIWDVEKVRKLAADRSHAATFLCGGSRNLHRFVDLLDEIFVLEVDLETLNRRLALRPEEEWSGSPGVGEASARLQHSTRKGIPQQAIRIDATAPIESVVDALLAHTDSSIVEC